MSNLGRSFRSAPFSLYGRVYLLNPHPSQLESAPPISRCDTFPLQWLRHEGEGSWRMLNVAPRCAALELDAFPEEAGPLWSAPCRISLAWPPFRPGLSPAWPHFWATSSPARSRSAWR